MFLNISRPPAVIISEGRTVQAGALTLEAAIPLAYEEQDELAAIVHEHSRLVYRVAFSVLRNHHDAEDATQEAFLRVLRYRSKLADVRDLKTWLASIAWRVAVERRRQSPEVPLDDMEFAAARLRSPEAAADQTLLGSELGSVMERLIAALPDNLRDPLALSTIEEMSPKDVAAVLGMNESAVRSRVFRARQILREKLAAVLGGTHAS
jgi:RNA polymerase sigma-70 factor (ECF subfamily)